MSGIIETQLYEPNYLLGASRGRHKAKHIIAEGVYDSGDFKTLCGVWGNAKQMPWMAGRMRVDAGGWCRRCKTAAVKIAREEQRGD